MQAVGGVCRVSSESHQCSVTVIAGLYTVLGCMNCIIMEPDHINGLVQERRNFSALRFEILLAQISPLTTLSNMKKKDNLLAQQKTCWPSSFFASLRASGSCFDEILCGPVSVWSIYSQEIHRIALMHELLTIWCLL